MLFRERLRRFERQRADRGKLGVLELANDLRVQFPYITGANEAESELALLRHALCVTRAPRELLHQKAARAGSV